MNDEFDSLEAELAALQPRRPSAALEQRVAAELERGPHRRRRTLTLILLAGAVAASLLVAIWAWQGGGDTAEFESPRAPIHQAVAVAMDPSLPSVWSFHAAESQPQAALDALLDRHAGRAKAEAAHYVQIRGFDVSETKRRNLMGDL